MNLIINLPAQQYESYKKRRKNKQFSSYCHNIMHTNSATLPILIRSASLSPHLLWSIRNHWQYMCSVYTIKHCKSNHSQSHPISKYIRVKCIGFILIFSRYLLLLPRIMLNVLDLLILHRTSLCVFLFYCHFFGLFPNLTLVKPFLSRSHRSHSLLATFSEITGALNLCFNTPNTCNYSFNIVEIFSEFVRSPSQKVMFSNLNMLLTSCVLFATSIYAMTQISQPLRTNNIWYSFRQFGWLDTRWKIWWRQTRSRHRCINGKTVFGTKLIRYIERKKKKLNTNTEREQNSQEPIVWEGEKMYNLRNDRLWIGRWERICAAFS